MHSIDEKRLDLGKTPFDLRYQRDMNNVASALDSHFNDRPGPRHWGVKGKRKVGFVLIIWPYGAPVIESALVANGANNEELKALFRHLLTKAEET